MGQLCCFPFSQAEEKISKCLSLTVSCARACVSYVCACLCESVRPCEARAPNVERVICGTGFIVSSFIVCVCVCVCVSVCVPCA